MERKVWEWSDSRRWRLWEEKVRVVASARGLVFIPLDWISRDRGAEASAEDGPRMALCHPLLIEPRISIP